MFVVFICFLLLLLLLLIRLLRLLCFVKPDLHFPEVLRSGRVRKRLLLVAAAAGEKAFLLPSQQRQSTAYVCHLSSEYSDCMTLWNSCSSSTDRIIRSRSTPISRPNKAGLDVCPSVHMYVRVRTYVCPSIRPQKVSPIQMKFARGRWLMHDGVPYGSKVKVKVT